MPCWPQLDEKAVVCCDHNGCCVLIPSNDGVKRGGEGKERGNDTSKLS